MALLSLPLITHGMISTKNKKENNKKRKKKIQEQQYQPEQEIMMKAYRVHIFCKCVRQTFILSDGSEPSRFEMFLAWLEI